MDLDSIAQKYGGTPSTDDIAAKYGGSVSTPSQGDIQEKPGFVQGLAQDIASPFLKSIATVSAAGARTISGIVGGKELADRARQAAIEQGVDFGYFGHNVKPIGAESFKQYESGDISGGETAKRMSLEAAGTLGEMGSYFIAPLEGIRGTGFLKTMAKSIPFATAFGLSKGLQAGGEGKGFGESTLEGGLTTLSTALGYGLLGKASSFVAAQGAKALQSEAFRAAGKALGDLTEKVWNVMPQAFQDTATKWTDNLVNTSFRRSYQALKSEFDSAWKKATNGAIESITPFVDNPELTTAKFQRDLSSKMGLKFQESSALYDKVKTDPTVISNMSSASTKAQDLISKMPETEGLTWELNPKNKAPLPMTMGKIIDLWQGAMQFLPKANPEQKVAIRDFASSLYSDARKVLEKENPDLLNQWDSAYQSWKGATDIYESGPLTQLKSVGDADTFIDKSLTKGLTRPEQEVFLESIKGNEEPVQNLFINSVLRKAKIANTPEEGAKIIRDFLDTWDFTSPSGEIKNAFLNEHQVKTLDDLATFMEGKFDDFVNGMRNSVGLKPEDISKFSLQQQKLNVAELVDKGDLNAISDNLLSIRDSNEFKQAISLLNPEERRVAGISMFKNLFNENAPLFSVNTDGTFNFSSLSKEIQKTIGQINKVGGKNKEGVLDMLYTPDQVQSFTKDIPKAIENLENVSKLPKSQARRLLQVVLAGFYAKIGLPGPAARHLGEAALAPSSSQYTEAVMDLVNKGFLNKNLPMKIGDLLSLLETPAGISAGQKTSDIIK